VLATCAGLILLAKEVTSPSQRSYGLLDVTVARNGYGRQIASGTFALDSATWPGLEGVFIRAPRITRVGAGVAVEATRAGDPCLVRRGPVLGACFHPELQPAHPVTAYFARSVRAFASRRPQHSPA
jgi:5'-phosphate synthase pdxT subunit